MTSSESIHDYFSLSYANYLVLHRTLMQSMPDEWQNRMVQCLNELEEAFSHIDQPEGFFVKAAVQRELWELSDNEMKRVLDGEVTYEFDEDDPEGERGGTYYVDGDERDSHYRVHLPAADPISHYDRGRARVEPGMSNVISD